MIKAISNQTNQNTMHTTHVQAPTPARRTTIFSRTRSLLRFALAASFMLCFTTVANAQWTDSNTGVTSPPVSGSTTGGEGYDKGCDGNTGTKHGGQPGNLPHYLVVQASQEVLLTGYTITTANDNASYTGRSPYTWKIQGSNTNNGSDWVDIASVTNDNVIQNVNYTEYTFSCSTSKYYTNTTD